jgi:hypothetical protein
MANGLKKCSWPKKVLTVLESSENTRRPRCVANRMSCDAGVYSISA